MAEQPGEDQPLREQCKSIAGEERNLWCDLDEGHDGPHHWYDAHAAEFGSSHVWEPGWRVPWGDGPSNSERNAAQSGSSGGSDV